MARLIQRLSPVPTSALMVACLLTLATAGTAEAYVGPGAGLTAIGSVLALLAAIGLAIVGFVWYPVKRMLKRKSVVAGDDDTTVRGRQ